MEQKKRINVTFQRGKDYHVYPISGAWGGLNPQGDLVADFYVERLSNPHRIELEVLDDEGHTKEIQRLGEEMVREVVFTAVIKPEVAKAIGNWMNANAEKALKQDK